MKVFLLVAILAIGVLWIRGQNAKENAKTREHAQAMIAEMQASPTPAASQPSSRRLTWSPGLGRYIEHDSGTSAMHSLGAGGGGPRPKAPPTSSEKVRSQFGWDSKGTALDQKPRR